MPQTPAEYHPAMAVSPKHPLLPRPLYLRRVALHAASAVGILLASLALGMAGYMYFEHLPWRDAFLNAAMMMTSPAYSANSPANSLPPSDFGASTGPMPPSSIAAFRNASRHGRCSKYM